MQIHEVKVLNFVVRSFLFFLIFQNQYCSVTIMIADGINI